MHTLIRTLPLTALLLSVGCGIENANEQMAPADEGIVGIGLETDVIDDAPAAGLLACSDAGWTTAWANLEAQVLTLVNQKRAAGATCGGVRKVPVPALALDSRLRCAARNHSKDMANKNYFSHTSQDGRTFDKRIKDALYTYSAAGENIAAGQTTAAAVMTSWMGSTGHCNNIMSPNYKHLGIGYAYNVSASYDHYWTQDFGKP